MSHLSDRCQQFLTESGTSVYQLSKTSGLDRASLHRLVTGKRIPTLEFLTKFCQAMRLNHADIQELFELYEESHAGSANFQNRKLICQIFSDLDGLSSASFQESPKTLSPDLLPPVFTSTRPIPSMAGNSRQTLGLVQQFLLRLFHEKPDGTEVLTNAPLARMGLLPFFYALQSLYHKHLRLHHLLYFSANPSLGADSNPNLEILRFVLPIALSDFNFYEPRFTYINLGKNDMEAMLWPYYIICEDLLLVLSASLDHAMLLAEPSSIKLCHTEMERLLSLSRPLLHRSSSAWESIAYYQEMRKKDIPVHSVLEFQPCVSSFVPSSQYAKLLPSITQAGGNPALIREFFQLSSVPFKCQNEFFSKEGLDEFCRSGKLFGQYGTYLPPLSLEKRKEALIQFTNAYRSQNSLQLLKKKLSFPADLNIEFFRHSSILFMYLKPDFQIHFVSLSESSLHEAFQDFFSSLAEPYNSHSSAETIQILENAIRKL